MKELRIKYDDRIMDEEDALLYVFQCCEEPDAEGVSWVRLPNENVFVKLMPYRKNHNYYVMGNEEP